MAEKKEFDKNKTAVALAYEAGDAAPKILASGKGYVAEQIIEEAKRPTFLFIRTMSWLRPSVSLI